MPKKFQAFYSCVIWLLIVSMSRVPWGAGESYAGMHDIIVIDSS